MTDWRFALAYAALYVIGPTLAVLVTHHLSTRKEVAVSDVTAGRFMAAVRHYRGDGPCWIVRLPRGRCRLYVTSTQTSPISGRRLVGPAPKGAFNGDMLVEVQGIGWVQLASVRWADLPAELVRSIRAHDPYAIGCSCDRVELTDRRNPLEGQHSPQPSTTLRIMRREGWTSYDEVVRGLAARGRLPRAYARELERIGPGFYRGSILGDPHRNLPAGEEAATHG